MGVGLDKHSDRKDERWSESELIIGGADGMQLVMPVRERDEMYGQPGLPAKASEACGSLW